MFHLLILLSVVASAWGLWLMACGSPSEKATGQVVLVAIPVMWMLWLDMGRQG